MNKISYFLLLVPMSILVDSCHKKEQVAELPAPQIEPPSNLPATFYPLKVGNYWIYQQFTFDAQGFETKFDTFDSVYILSDTLLRGRKFFKMFRPIYGQPSVKLLADSGLFLIDNMGRIISSRENTNTLLSTEYHLDFVSTDTLFRTELRMTDFDAIVTVPAGTFKTSNALSTHFIAPKLVQSGISSPKFTHCKLARNIGPVYETAAILTTDMIWGRRLIRYHLN
jgi:hypothetical protein